MTDNTDPLQHYINLYESTICYLAIFFFLIFWRAELKAGFWVNKSFRMGADTLKL